MKAVSPKVLALLAALVLSAQAEQGTQPAKSWPTVQIGEARSRLAPSLTPNDVALTPPEGGAAHAPILGYAHRWRPDPPAVDRPRVQRPLQSPFDSDDPAWWDGQLDQLLYARVPVAFLSARNCRFPDDPRAYEGNGGMCPHKLRMMNEAVRRAGAGKAIRFAMFVDTAGPVSARRWLLRRTGKNDAEAAQDSPRAFTFDLSRVPDAAGRMPAWYFWDSMIRPWFDAVSRDLWYTIPDGGKRRPVIVFWGIGHRFSNQAGNAAALLQDIRAAFVERYRVAPFFVVADSWITTDPGLADSPLVGGVHSWFSPRFGTDTRAPAIRRWSGGRWSWSGTPNGYASLTEWGGRSWGVSVVGFDCGPECRVAKLPREHGTHFRDVLAANRGAALNLVEGFNGPLEGTAVFPSAEPGWDFPNQYLDILRRSADPATGATRLRASAADDLFGHDQAVLPSGEHGLQVSEPGEVFRFRQVFFAPGRYRLALRAGGGHRGASFTVRIGAASATATVPTAAQGAPELAIADLGTLDIGAGEADVTVSSGDPDTVVDWLHVARVSDRASHR